MQIISHRGFWHSIEEMNNPVAFARSFDLGFGTETDIRDIKGKLVISHDMPDGSEIGLAEFLDLLDGRDLPIAFNIKADGLAATLAAQLAERQTANWFTFDMSPPELIYQLRRGLPAYTRASEFERQPLFYEKAHGIWLDSFDSDWFDASDVQSFLEDGKRVCIVSPELHKRDFWPLWRFLKDSAIGDHPSVMLCTDHPDKAKIWFGSAK